MHKWKMLSILFVGLMVFKAHAVERWYDVEVIVVEHKDQSAVVDEEWPAYPGMPQIQNAYSLILEDDAIEQREFSVIPKEELKLNQAVESLVRRTGSRVVLHQGWVQAVQDNNEKEPIRLTAGEQIFENDGVFELDGTIALSLSRYLHVNTDLVFFKPTTLIKQTSANTKRLKPESGQWRQRNGVELTPFRLQERRKIKKGDVVYIDHPLYGVLIQVTDHRA